MIDGRGWYACELVEVLCGTSRHGATETLENEYALTRIAGMSWRAYSPARKRDEGACRRASAASLRREADTRDAQREGQRRLPQRTHAFDRRHAIEPANRVRHARPVLVRSTRALSARSSRPFHHERRGAGVDRVKTTKPARAGPVVWRRRRATNPLYFRGSPGSSQIPYPQTNPPREHDSFGPIQYLSNLLGWPRQPPRHVLACRRI